MTKIKMINLDNLVLTSLLLVYFLLVYHLLCSLSLSLSKSVLIPVSVCAFKQGCCEGKTAPLDPAPLWHGRPAVKSMSKQGFKFRVLSELGFMIVKS
jgi:hypothetical protein